jgi:hypothetical protein
VQVAQTSDLIPAIYTEDPALEPQWNKVHIRGVDDFHTNDILSFAHDHFVHNRDDIDVHVQWIDDTAANICFRDSETAKQAHLAFLNTPITQEELENSPFQLRTAKPLTTRPGSMLVVRVAQAQDRKQRGARDASRYYLLHPGEDPTEKPRRDFANGRGGREDNGDYRRRRFDDREHRRRRDNDHDAGGQDFSANMYDDAPAAETDTSSARGRDLFSRITKGRKRSASPGARTRNSDEIDISDSDDDRPRRNRNYRDRSDRAQQSNAGKELFSSQPSTKKGAGGGGMRSDRLDLFPSKPTSAPANNTDTAMTIDQTRPRNQDAANQRANAAAARRLKADLMNATQTSPRSNHRRTHAMDAKNDEDLAERFSRKSISIDSTKSFKNGNGNAGVELFPSSSSHSNGGGLSVRGAAAANGGGGGFSIKGSGGISIKGRAEVKELFPSQYDRNGRNEGKELFDAPVRQRQQRRQARDLFD